MRGKRTLRPRGATGIPSAYLDWERGKYLTAAATLRVCASPDIVLSTHRKREFGHAQYAFSVVSAHALEVPMCSATSIPRWSVRDTYSHQAARHLVASTVRSCHLRALSGASTSSSPVKQGKNRVMFPTWGWRQHLLVASAAVACDARVEIKVLSGGASLGASALVGLANCASAWASRLLVGAARAWLGPSPWEAFVFSISEAGLPPISVLPSVSA
eukprot:scaffold1564_cov389-Prasinococcus_capsulatus_cf.AAC.29